MDPRNASFAPRLGVPTPPMAQGPFIPMQFFNPPYSMPLAPPGQQQIMYPIYTQPQQMLLREKPPIRTADIYNIVNDAILGAGLEGRPIETLFDIVLDAADRCHRQVPPFVFNDWLGIINRGISSGAIKAQLKDNVVYSDDQQNFLRIKDVSKAVPNEQQYVPNEIPPVFATAERSDRNCPSNVQEEFTGRVSVPIDTPEPELNIDDGGIPENSLRNDDEVFHTPGSSPIDETLQTMDKNDINVVVSAAVLEVNDVPTQRDDDEPHMFGSTDGSQILDSYRGSWSEGDVMLDEGIDDVDVLQERAAAVLRSQCSVNDLPKNGYNDENDVAVQKEPAVETSISRESPDCSIASSAELNTSVSTKSELSETKDTQAHPENRPNSNRFLFGGYQHSATSPVSISGDESSKPVEPVVIPVKQTMNTTFTKLPSISVILNKPPSRSGSDADVVPLGVPSNTDKPVKFVSTLSETLRSTPRSKIMAPKSQQGGASMGEHFRTPFAVDFGKVSKPRNRNDSNAQSTEGSEGSVFAPDKMSAGESSRKDNIVANENTRSGFTSFQIKSQHPLINSRFSRPNGFSAFKPVTPKCNTEHEVTKSMPSETENHIDVHKNANPPQPVTVESVHEAAEVVLQNQPAIPVANGPANASQQNENDATSSISVEAQKTVDRPLPVYQPDSFFKQITTVAEKLALRETMKRCAMRWSKVEHLEDLMFLLRLYYDKNGPVSPKDMRDGALERMMGGQLGGYNWEKSHNINVYDLWSMTKKEDCMLVTDGNSGNAMKLVPHPDILALHFYQLKAGVASEAYKILKMRNAGSQCLTFSEMERALSQNLSDHKEWVHPHKGSQLDVLYLEVKSHRLLFEVRPSSRKIQFNKDEDIYFIVIPDC